MSEAWHPEELAWLRDNYATDGPVAIARLLRRSVGSVKSKARKIGVATRKAWTADQLETVRRLYLKVPSSELARRIGRSARAVYQAAKKLGLRKQPRHNRATLRRMRQLHSQDLSDREIATAVGITRDSAKAIRADRLRLPVNYDLEGKRQAVRTQLERLGLRNTGELRALSFRRFAVENGWPEDLRPREVQVLNVLAGRGVPMTRLELAQAIGMRTDVIGRRGGRGRGTLDLLKGNGPGGTYTANLLQRGMLSVLRRAATVNGRGRGRSRDLYMLGPKALAILQERARCETNGAS